MREIRQAEQSNNGVYNRRQKRNDSDTLTEKQLTFDFLPDRHVKLTTLELLSCWDLHRKAATIQYLSTTDWSHSAVFPYEHLACSLEGLQGVAVPVWTLPRSINLSQTRVGEVYFVRVWGMCLQVPGEFAVETLQRKRAGVSLDDVATARLGSTFWEDRDYLQNKQAWTHLISISSTI